MKAPIPMYAVKLLEAAKFVSWPPKGSTPDMLVEGLDRLLQAVVVFESSMPIVDGRILIDQSGAATDEQSVEGAA